MSYHLFFNLVEGLRQTIKVPIGTLNRINNHVKNVETKLNIKRTKFSNNQECWNTNNFKNIPDELLCKTASVHNHFVRTLYSDLEEWTKTPPKKYEEITPKQAEWFFVGLSTITVPPYRWTSDYYLEQMETIYEVIRGRETNGISFDEKPLTEKQAAAIINLFGDYLDNFDLNLEVPEGHDYLASSYDGGYDWCIMRGAVLWEDIDIDDYKCNTCKYRDECPLYEEKMEQNGEDNF